MTRSSLSSPICKPPRMRNSASWAFPFLTGTHLGEALIASGAEGLELAEQDLPAFHSFFAAQREAGVDAAAIGAAVGWYLRTNAGAAEQRYEADLTDAGRIQDNLKAEWGRDYELNIAESKRFLEAVPGIAEAITSARMADGSLLVHQEGFPDFLLSLAKGRSAPAQKEAPVASTPRERLAQIEEVLRTDSRRYFHEKPDEEALKLRRKVEKSPGTPRPVAEQNLVKRGDAINVFISCAACFSAGRLRLPAHHPDRDVRLQRSCRITPSNFVRMFSRRPLEPSEPSQSRSQWREPSKSLRRLRIRASW